MHTAIAMGREPKLSLQLDIHFILVDLSAIIHVIIIRPGSHKRYDDLTYIHIECLSIHTLYMNIHIATLNNTVLFVDDCFLFGYF